MSPLAFLYTGLALGLTQGLSPGPHSALVITRTLRGSFKDGVMTAIAPIPSTLVIIAITLPFITWFSDNPKASIALSLFGAFFLFFLGLENLKTKEFTVAVRSSALQSSFWVGAGSALLSPHPYLFWTSLGNPLLIQGWRLSYFHPVCFLFGFSVAFILAKLLLALLISRVPSNDFNQQNGLVLNLIRTMGVVLILFAFFLARDGWIHLAHLETVKSL